MWKKVNNSVIHYAIPSLSVSQVRYFATLVTLSGDRTWQREQRLSEGPSSYSFPKYVSLTPSIMMFIIIFPFWGFVICQFFEIVFSTFLCRPNFIDQNIKQKYYLCQVFVLNQSLYILWETVSIMSQPNATRELKCFSVN